MTTDILTLNEINQHPRDAEIEFFPEPHVYQVGGENFKSATSLIDEYFEPFDTAFWSKYKSNQLGISKEEVLKQWDTTAALGTSMHAQIEGYFLNGSKDTTKEFGYFLDFIRSHHSLKPYRTEWAIYHEKYRVAGTLDLLATNNGKFEIYDWKRSKNVVNIKYGTVMKHAYANKRGLGVLAHIPDTNYHKYCLQQSMYRYILEHKYGLEIAGAYLIVLHPKLKSYHKVEVTYYPNEIESILEEQL